MEDNAPRAAVGSAAYRSYYRRVRERAWRNLRAHIKGQVMASFAVAVIIGVLALVLGGAIASLGYAIVGFGLYALTAALFYARIAPVELEAELSAELDMAVSERDAALHPPSVPVELSKLDDTQYEDFVFFRLRVRNIGDRKALFRARVAELACTDPRGAEAPFELGWRHGNNKWAVEISPDDDEVWIDVGRMPKYSLDTVSRVEPERWGVAIYFRVLAREDQDATEAAAPILGVRSGEDLRRCNAYARITIRHANTGVVVANKMARFYYDEIDGVLVPQMLLSDNAPTPTR